MTNQITLRQENEIVTFCPLMGSLAFHEAPAMILPALAAHWSHLAHGGRGPVSRRGCHRTEQSVVGACSPCSQVHVVTWALEVAYVLRYPW